MTPYRTILLSFLFLTGISAANLRVVFLGASITYGAVRDGKVLQKMVRESQDPGVEIFSEAVSGWTSTRLASKIDEFVKKHPRGTYFVIHIGGNDVSIRRPYPGGAVKLRKNLEKILQTIQQYGSHPILMRLSFRAYKDSLEEDGSLPYNLEVYD